MQVTPSQLVTAQFNSDPITGFIVDYWGASADLGALTGQNQNECSGFGCLGSVRWSGVFGTRVSAEAAWAQAAGNITVVPVLRFRRLPSTPCVDGLYYNGATFVGSSTVRGRRRTSRPRCTMSSSATRHN